MRQVGQCVVQAKKALLQGASRCKQVVALFYFFGGVPAYAYTTAEGRQFSLSLRLRPLQSPLPASCLAGPGLCVGCLHRPRGRWEGESGCSAPRQKVEKKSKYSIGQEGEGNAARGH